MKMWLAVQSIAILHIICSACGIAARNAVIVASLPYDLGLAPDIIRTGSAFDLATEMVDEKYAGHLNVTVTYLYNPAHRSCQSVSSETASRLAEYYYQQARPETCYAIVSVGKLSIPTPAVWLQYELQRWPHGMIVDHNDNRAVLCSAAWPVETSNDYPAKRKLCFKKKVSTKYSPNNTALFVTASRWNLVSKLFPIRMRTQQKVDMAKTNGTSTVYSWLRQVDSHKLGMLWPSFPKSPFCCRHLSFDHT